ncbi:MAG: sodium/proton-translocating pyrophosphatase, partial [Acidobacteriota bacterium]
MNGAEWMTWVPAVGGLGLVVAGVMYGVVARAPAGTERMRAIGDAIHEGAMVFLRREYTILAVFIAAVFSALSLWVDVNTAGAFIAGAVCSMTAGFVGMQAATRANVRTSEAARTGGQAKALVMAFSGGTVMGLTVASLGLIGVGAFFLIYGDPEHARVINGFAMGASSIALFARVGGGIYTKAADVGADLVGKVEAGIPEDDPRNPGVIADNVGDNVGDVAGMGADIFESYVGSIVATIAIGATMAHAALGKLQGDAGTGSDTLLRSMLMSLPLLLAALGLLASLVGIASMSVLKNVNPAAALRYSTFIAAALFLGGAWMVIDAQPLSGDIFWAVFWGTVGGILIGLITEYYTSMG